MEIFRKKGFKIFFAFFAAFFMGVFGFGVINFFNGDRDLVTVGGKEIKPQDYLKAYENIAAHSRQLRQNQTPIKNAAKNAKNILKPFFLKISIF